MRIYLGCVPCFTRQALEAASMSTEDEKIREEIVRRVMREAAEIPFDKTPVHMGMYIHRIVRELTGNRDPYAHLKKLYNDRATEILPEVEKLVRDSEEPLKTAVKVAIAGNSIDFGIANVNHEIDLIETIEDSLRREFAIDWYNDFVEALKDAGNILYLADNNGEIVFDKILIKQIPEHEERVTLVVKKSPIINDVTLEDALYVGMDKLVREIIDNGIDAPGTLVDECSDEFLKRMESADLIISKGQGNYEGLSGTGYPIFFLLKAKCEVIASHLNVRVGDIILLKEGEQVGIERK